MNRDRRVMTRRKRNRRRPPATVLRAIVDDVADRIPGGKLVVVGPADDQDCTLLFVTDRGRIRMTIGVPPELIRSRRLRGEQRQRDREAEELFEAFRIVEAEADFDADFRDLL